ncbi:MAG: glycoside hydrolase family 3 N-terminal domain-containing protein [Bacilli bacterium]
MNIEEKSALLEGKKSWYTHKIPSIGLESIILTDGPHGLRMASATDGGFSLGQALPSTCFPTAVNLASSFDKTLAQEEGKTIAEECLHYGVSVILGPGACLKRNPLCGRNFEYFSEDPFLSGVMAGNWIKGAEEQGISTSLKHYVTNNCENYRVMSDSIVDERALNELYLRNFKIAIDIGSPSTIMCSYNSCNGQYLAENEYLLKNKLREEYAYKGVVMTDWGACHDRVKAIKVGCDLDMPGGVDSNRQSLIDAYGKDEEFTKCLDISTERVLKLVNKGLANRKEYHLNKET